MQLCRQIGIVLLALHFEGIGGIVNRKEGSAAAFVNEVATEGSPVDAVPLQEEAVHLRRAFHPQAEKTNFLDASRWIRGRLGDVIGKDEEHFLEQVESFFGSGRWEEWISLGGIITMGLAASLLMSRWKLDSMLSASAVVSFWILIAGLCAGFVYLKRSEDDAGDFIEGWVLEFIFSIENIMIYQIILAELRVPGHCARVALFYVAAAQILFQVGLYLGFAGYITQISCLSYFLGAWLIFLGYQALRDDEHDSSFDGAQSDVYAFCHILFGDRLLPTFCLDGHMFDKKDGRLCVNMLFPVTIILTLVMCCVEIDVTLTKLEEFDAEEYIAYASSAIATLALPDLFTVVSMLFKNFYLLKTGVALIMVMFGILLLIADDFQPTRTQQIAAMLTVIFGSIVLSPVLGYGKRDAPMYKDEVDEDGGKEVVAKDQGAGVGPAAQALGRHTATEEDAGFMRATSPGCAHALLQVSAQSSPSHRMHQW